MSDTATERQDALRWRLGAFQRQVERARAVVREGLAVMRRPYVAFSGGKDSLVVLDLVREQRPDIVVIWGDDELEHEETVSHLVDLEHRWALSLVRVAGHPRHPDGWMPWTELPFWREPEPGTIRIETTRQGYDWAADQGYDGAFLGLRKAESGRRRLYLGAMGRLHTTQQGWRCNPIAHWTVDDVWAYIVGRELPYNPVYDRLAQIDVPRAEQRVGPLPLAPGWQLRQGWPDLYRRLLDRYGQRW